LKPQPPKRAISEGVAKLDKLKEATSMIFYEGRLFFNFYQAKQFVQLLVN
jgi:hypothetical protein